MTHTPGARVDPHYPNLWQPTVDGRPTWTSHGASRSFEAALKAATAQCAKLDAEEAALADAQALMARYESRAQIEHLGFRPGWHGEPVKVGDIAVVYGTGQWRRGRVTKVGPSIVTVAYVTPSTPDRVWFGKGRRDGQQTNLYVPA